jgi:hypothetical protein
MVEFSTSCLGREQYGVLATGALVTEKEVVDGGDLERSRRRLMQLPPSTTTRRAGRLADSARSEHWQLCPIRMPNQPAAPAATTTPPLPPS